MFKNMISQASSGGTIIYVKSLHFPMLRFYSRALELTSIPDPLPNHSYGTVSPNPTRLLIPIFLRPQL
jgi:hypothetical protein